MDLKVDSLAFQNKDGLEREEKTDTGNNSIEKEILATLHKYQFDDKSLENNLARIQ